jgi:hypothetical protein
MVKLASAVLRAWRKQETEGDIPLLIETDLPPEDAHVRIRKVCEKLDLRDVNGQDVAELFVAPVANGTALWIANCDDLEEVLARLAAALEHSGLASASIRPLPTSDTGVPEIGLAFLKCELALRGSPVEFPVIHGPELPKRIWHWAVSSEDLADAADYLMMWLAAMPEASDLVSLSTGAPFVDAPRDVAARVIRAATTALSPDATAIVVAKTPNGFRIVSVDPGAGYASAAVGTTSDSTFDWAQALQETRDVISHAGPWARSGYITRGMSFGGTHVGFSLHAGERGMPPGVPVMPAERRGLDEKYILDAFGLLMRRDLPDLSSYQDAEWTKSLVGDMTLMEHRNPAAWFGAGHIDRGVHAAARKSISGFLPPG